MMRLLLIEDNYEDAELFGEMLKGVEDFDLVHVTRVTEGLSILKQQSNQVVILDLNLPDCAGLEALERVRQVNSESPVIVLTGSDDDNLAAQSRERGAQDYLVKSKIDKDRVLRTVRYVIDRMEWRSMVQAELASILPVAPGGETSLTAGSLGPSTLRERCKSQFNQFAKRYSEAIEVAIYQRTYKVESDLSSLLRRMGNDLGEHGAGPRDAIEIHTQVIRQFPIQMKPEQSKVFQQESRLILLQLMGYLCAYYRRHSMSISGRIRTAINKTGSIGQTNAPAQTGSLHSRPDGTFR